MVLQIPKMWGSYQKPHRKSQLPSYQRYVRVLILSFCLLGCLASLMGDGFIEGGSPEPTKEEVWNALWSPWVSLDKQPGSIADALGAKCLKFADK